VDGRALRSERAEAEAKAHGDGTTGIYGADRAGVSGVNELHAGSGSAAGWEASTRCGVR
jgi:hypothetical protein